MITPTNNRHIYCKECIVIRKKEQNKDCKNRNRGLHNTLCRCGTIYVPYRNQKQCNKCVGLNRKVTGINVVKTIKEAVKREAPPIDQKWLVRGKG